MRSDLAGPAGRNLTIRANDAALVRLPRRPRDVEALALDRCVGDAEGAGVLRRVVQGDREPRALGGNNRAGLDASGARDGSDGKVRRRISGPRSTEDE